MSSSILRLSVGVPNGFQIETKTFYFPNFHVLFFKYFSSCFFLQTDQLMSEKLTGADHTKLDDQFTKMEKITDVFLEAEVSPF